MGVHEGYREGRTITERDCLLDSKIVRYGRGKLDATYAYDGANTDYEYELRPGTPLGRITASGLWRACARTKTTTTGTVTSVVVTDARAFKVGDVITIGGDTGITISAINYSTNTLTIASTTVASGDAVFCEDGSATCRGILNENINLKDEDGVARDKSFSQMVILGYVDPNQILGDLAAIRAASGMYLNFIQWADYQGQQ